MRNTITVQIKDSTELNACKDILEVYGYRQTADFENNTPYYILVDVKQKIFHSTEIANNELNFANFVKVMTFINQKFM